MNADLGDYERRLIENVDEYGCFILSVASREGDEWEPPFSYSIGFSETVEQPEVIIFGLGPDLTRPMINETLRQCRGGLELSDGTRIDGLLEGFECVVRAVKPEHIVRDYFNSAMWYRRYKSGLPLDRAVQIVWPGAVDGLFPWDEGSDAFVRDMQPPLYEEATCQ